MSSLPLVSVVLSVYNGQKYLAEAIESILNQTYINFEFIIINDGSTDKSFEIIRQYQKQDNRVMIISRENRGLIASLNEGIKKAKGKYIARMDADDISLPTRLEEQINFMETHNDVGVCGTWIEVMKTFDKNRIWKLPIDDNQLKVRLLFTVPFAHPSIMMRKHIIDTYKLHYKEAYKDAEDYHFWFDFSKHTKFATLPTVLLNYRYLESSITRTADHTKTEIRFEIISSIFTKVLRELGVNNTEKENRLHFILGLNKLIQTETIDIKIVKQYLYKLLQANEKTNVFDTLSLKKFLAKRFLSVVYYQILKYDIKVLLALSSKLFWIASVDVIKSKFFFWRT